ncbi:MAG: hypothetical protein R3195_17000 [Gemmatimonadota bacterium]|nr:hypothetical protein [Gemmatimonadota bacterium]
MNARAFHRPFRRPCRLAMLAAAIVAGSALDIAAQECTTDDGPGHDDWHRRQRALETFEDSLKAILVDTGGSPVGGVAIRLDPATGERVVEPRMLSLPPEATGRFDGAVDALLAGAPLAPGDEVLLDIGQPRSPTWPDRTERCEAELDNVAEVGGLVAQVVAGAIDQEGKARPAGRIRIDLWTRVEWTGRVGAMELREDAGQWTWLAPYLQALAPAMRYRPATLNGVPVTTWMSQPFELEF